MRDDVLGPGQSQVAVSAQGRHFALGTRGCWRWHGIVELSEPVAAGDRAADEYERATHDDAAGAGRACDSQHHRQPARAGGDGAQSRRGGCVCVAFDARGRGPVTEHAADRAHFAADVAQRSAEGWRRDYGSNDRRPLDSKSY
jgi:hypothetical protein